MGDLGVGESGEQAVVPRAEFRASWEQFGELLNYAITRPQVQAIPEIADVLCLMAEGIVALIHDVDRATYGPPSNARQVPS